eukprot:jgi/Tetstr1/425216/TSEL_015677.t1
MDLAALVAAKRKAKEGEFGGRKYVKRGELEEARLRAVREEEEQERAKKLARKPAPDRGAADADQPEQSRRVLQKQELEKQLEALTKEEIIRRLRLLRQPATLFGESDLERLHRLLKAEEELDIGDEHVGGQQGNLFQEMEKERLREAERQAAEKRMREVDKKSKEEEEQEAMMAMFTKAADRLKDKQREEVMTADEKIMQAIGGWMKEWEDDLAQRPEGVKRSMIGSQATNIHAQTKKFFKPLVGALKRGDIHPEVRLGLHMMVSAMKERNYLKAYDVYMRISVGNAPWPIGVTSVGIHERSAREKISFSCNGQAHIMNDEATRKYLQGMKRLITWTQRAYPTDPSRCVDFGGFDHAGLGAAGGGSDKKALLASEAAGLKKEVLALPDAPHFMEKDGTVK